LGRYRICLVLESAQTGYEGVEGFNLGGRECELVNVNIIAVRRSEGGGARTTTNRYTVKIGERSRA
jgi:hypothetical protein